MQDHAQSPVAASQPFEAGAEGLPARSVEPWAEAGRAFQAGDPRFLTSGKLFGMHCSLLGRIGHGDGD